jgi:hypothetical protein
MYFHKVGWLKNADYAVKFFNDEWHYQATNETWQPLLTPFVGQWNDNYHLLLDTRGRIFVSKKDNSSHFEIRLIGGEWCYNAIDEWASLDDMYE